MYLQKQFKLMSTFEFLTDTWTMFWVTNDVLSNLTGAILQDDVKTNFQFQRLGPCWYILSQSCKILVDRLGYVD